MSISTSGEVVEMEPISPVRADSLRISVSIVVFGCALTYLGLGPVRPGPLWVHAAAQAAFLVPYAVLCALSAILAVRSGSAERRFWIVLGSAVALLFVSEVISSAVGLGTDAPKWVALSVLLSSIAALLFTPLLVAMSRYGHLTWTTRARFVVDVLLVAVVANLAVLFSFVLPFELMAGGGFDAALLSSLYITFGSLLVFGVLMNTGWGQVGAVAVWERLVALGVGMFGVGTMLWPLWNAASQGLASTAWLTTVEGLWVFGIAFTAVGAVHRLAHPSQAWTQQRFRAPEGRASWLPSAVFVVASVTVPVAVAIAVTSSRSDVSSVLLVSAMCLFVLLSIRSAVLAVEFRQQSRNARTDALTGLANHRELHDRLDAEVQTALLTGKALSVGILDIDGFRRVNIAAGHREGDRMLAAIAHGLAAEVRDAGWVSRSSSDEFVVVLPELTPLSARGLARRLQGVVAAQSAALGEPLTATVGLAGLPDHASDVGSLLRLADAAQYRGKADGRGKVVVFEFQCEDDNRLGIRAVQGYRETQLQTVRVLANAVDARDPDCQHHSANVARLVVLLGRAVGFTEARLEQLELAATVHDIGKLAVPDASLFKTGRLSGSDWRQIRRHPEIAEQILAGRTEDAEILPWIRSHHERWDGTGYPDRLEGHEIPFEARILAVCDAYDAMVSDRPHRLRKSPAAALQEIDHNLGTQFDPVVGETFIRIVSGLIGESHDGRLGAD